MLAPRLKERYQILVDRLKHGKHDQSSHGRRGAGGGGGLAPATMGAKPKPSAGQMSLFDVFDAPTPAPVPAPTPTPTPAPAPKSTGSTIRSDTGATVMTIGRNDFAPKPKPDAPVAETPKPKPKLEIDRRVKGWADMNPEERRLTELEAQAGPYQSYERNLQWATKKMTTEFNAMYRNEAKAKAAEFTLSERIRTLPESQRNTAQNAAAAAETATSALSRQLSFDDIKIGLRNPRSRLDVEAKIESEYQYELSNTAAYGTASRKQQQAMQRTYEEARDIAVSRAVQITAGKIDTRGVDDSILLQTFTVRQQKARADAKMPLLKQRFIDIVLGQ
jgi:hypothetical protein